MPRNNNQRPHFDLEMMHHFFSATKHLFTSHSLLVKDKHISTINITQMKTIHPFYCIGSSGIIITALLHIALALVLAVATSHAVFMALYPSFFAFMTIGIGFTIKEQRVAATKD